MQGLNVESLKKVKEMVKKKGFEKLVVSAQSLGLDLSLLSHDAMLVVKGLQKKGFRAYLVGGCIRDLLLGKEPKDFDVSTDATPEQVHKIFNNSRIIGRRFKIVHVVYSGVIIEVTTFRSNQVAPKSVQKSTKNSTRVSAQSGMLIRDNVYGKNIVEDSQRRDFTINALYLDPIKQEIYDYNGGLYDLTQGVLDLIGDPDVRYSEDPVRMIRALRFSAKLGFKISKRSSDPIKRLSHKLLEVSNARMFEEVNKLFLTGHGYESFKVLCKYNLFTQLFPDTYGLIENKSYCNFIEFALKSSDQRFAENKRNMPHFLFSVILWNCFQRVLFGLRRNNDAMINPLDDDALVNLAFQSVFTNQDKVTDLPFAVTDNIKSLWRMQLLLQQYSENGPYSPDSLSVRNIFRASFDFLSLRAKFEPYLEPIVEFWSTFYKTSKALADKRHAANVAKRNKKQADIDEKKTKKKKGKAKKRPSEEGFEDESNLSEKRKAQLAKARAWRESMNLKN